MQNEYFSDHQSGHANIHQSDNDQAVDPGFTITHQDSAILQGYLDEFQEAETDQCTRLVERVMAELYMLRPDGTPFDKKEARKGCPVFSSNGPSILFFTSENTKVVLQSLCSSQTSVPQVHSQVVSQKCLLSPAL